MISNAISPEGYLSSVTLLALLCACYLEFLRSSGQPWCLQFVRTCEEELLRLIAVCARTASSILFTSYYLSRRIYFSEVVNLSVEPVNV